MKARRSTETEVWILSAAAVLSGLIAILDLFGLLDTIKVPGLASRVPVLALLVLSLVAGISTRIPRRFDTLDGRMDEILAFARAEVTERITILRKQINPSLEAVFGDQISELVTKLTSAVKDQRFDIYDIGLFMAFYKKTMEAFPHAAFVATSLPYRSYFWGNVPMEEAMRRFIDNGGSMTRVFFINHPNELNKAEVKTVLQDQLNMGVEVYVVDARRIPDRLRQLFVVDLEGRIAWEVHAVSGKRITHVVATSEPAAINSYRRVGDELLELAETRRYNP